MGWRFLTLFRIKGVRAAGRFVYIAGLILVVALQAGCRSSDKPNTDSLDIGDSAACRSNAPENERFPVTAVYAMGELADVHDGSVGYFQTQLAGLPSRYRNPSQWGVLRRSNDQVTFGHVGPSLPVDYVTTVRRVNNGWVESYDECAPPIRVFKNAETGRVYKPEGSVSRRSTSLKLLTLMFCDERPPSLLSVEESQGRIVVFAGFRRRNEGETCHGGRYVPLKVKLKHPLGSRRLLDGGFVPPRRIGLPAGIPD